MGKYMIIPYILLGVMDVRYLKLSLIHKNRTGKSIALFMESNLVAVILGIIMQGIGSNFIDSILIWPFYACFTWMILALIEYAFEYTGLGKAFECFKYIKRAVFVFTIVDTINMFIHSIIRIENVRMNKSGVAAWLYNLGYDAHIFITYVFVAVFILCFIYRILNSPRIYKVKYMQILTCMIIVSCINIVMFQLRLWENASLLFYGILGAFVYEITFQYSHKVVKNRALQKIAEESELPMVVFGTDDSIIAYNKEAERLFDKCTQKCSLEEFCKAYNLYTPAALEKTYHKKISIMHEDKKLYFQCKYGELCENDNIAYAKYFVFEDITEITIVNSVMRYLETHDELTGLYNMKRFYEKVNEITNKYPDDKFAIMIFNISRFKIVNDMFGRKMGDAILKQISENCLAQCSDKRVYARVESDNFITLCPKSDLVIKDLEKKRNIKVTYNNITCTVHIRYGIYEVDYDSKVDVGTMCDRARMALDSIKNNGNCVAAVYNDNLRNKILKEHMYKEELTSAIENEDFKVYLQPQVRCEDGLVKGAEALVRWEHRKLGLIPPGDFIEFFEQNGLITELDMYVWEKVCQILKQWKEEGRDDYIAVNISMKDFYIIDLYKVFTNLIEKYGIDKNKLRLEITESAFTLDLEKNVNVIKKLQMFGFIVEMDDFGSGYSSLNALKDIPVNIIKMDMRFVSQTQDPARADTIIKMILAMAKELNMEVVAEGVETVEQAEKLKQYGCSYIQGYLYAKPMPTEEYPEFVKNMKQGNFKR